MDGYQLQREKGDVVALPVARRGLVVDVEERGDEKDGGEGMLV